MGGTVRDPTVSTNVVLTFTQSLISSRMRFLLYKANSSGSGAQYGA